MTDRELMQQALDYLDAPSSKVWAAGTQYKIIQALRDRLAQPEQEPVAWMHIQGDHEDPCFCELTEDEISRGWTQKPLYYTAPPQREWQGLTDEEMFSLWVKCPAETEDRFAFARAIEAKLKEKNT